MQIDYIVASLQPLSFDGAAPCTWEQFVALLPEGYALGESARWRDLEAQLRNAMAIARGGEKYCRPAEGCDLYWRRRVTEAFQEKDPLRRETLLDRVWWDAAGELTSPASPLSRGALDAYAIRLKILIRRGRMSKTAGEETFERIADSALQKQSTPTDRNL